MRGMGIRLWLFFQSLDQLKKCFGDNAGTVLDNLAHAAVFLDQLLRNRRSDVASGSATKPSSSAPRATISGTSSPIGGDGKNPRQPQQRQQHNTSEIARRLLKPEEILVLPEHAAIVFHKNNYVIVCDKIKYYADRAFRRRGIIFRRWGTGRTRGLGLGGMVLGLAALALAFVVTMVVASMPVGDRPPAAVRRHYSAAASISNRAGLLRSGGDRARFYP